MNDISSNFRLARWMAAFGLLVLAGSFLMVIGGAAPSRDLPNLDPRGLISSNDSPPRRSVAVAFVDIEEGTTPLYPTRLGRVVEVPVREGAPVKKGDLLLRVDDSLARIELDRAQHALKAAEVRLHSARNLVAKHQKQIEALQEAVEVQKAEQAEAEAGLAKARSFFENKLGGTREDVLILEKKVAKAAAGVRAKQKELQAAQALDAMDAVRAAEIELADKKDQLRAAQQGVEECVIRAPKNGSLLRVLVNVGEVLGPNPQRPALVFCADAPRIIRAEVEQEFAGQIKLGQNATIRDDATGRGNWTGKVMRVSDWYAHRRSILFEPMQYNDVRTLEVILSVEPNGTPLKIGQRVLVTLEGLGN
ncbi:MAG: biotin/lipoyl-binding protein [Gemmataceae bacterium]